MKLMMCGHCSAIVCPHRQAGQWRSCDCGRARVRWTDPQAGRLEVEAGDLDKVRVIGLHNAMLSAGFAGLHGRTPEGDEGWRTTHQLLCDTADGYLFHPTKRNCWAVLIGPGETGDIAWSGSPGD